MPARAVLADGLAGFYFAQEWHEKGSNAARHEKGYGEGKN